jgi:hypothetical protein
MNELKSVIRKLKNDFGNLRGDLLAEVGRENPKHELMMLREALTS